MTIPDRPMIEIYGPPLAPPVDYARWTLDRMGMSYRMVPAAAVVSALRSSRMKVPIEPPLMLHGRNPVGGFRTSYALLHDAINADAQHPLPAPDPEFAEDLFATLFTQAVRCFYREMLAYPMLLKPMSTMGVPAWHRWAVKGGYPIWRTILAKGIKLDTTDAATDNASMTAAFDRVAVRLGDSPFLAGETPGADDILFAVMASPVILPTAHPVAMPDVQSLPFAFRSIVERYRALPAGALAQRAYAHRHAAPA